jgi:hypothetical protein
LKSNLSLCLKKSYDRIEVLARFRFRKEFMNRLLRFILGNCPCLPTGDINPPSFRTCSGMQLDRLRYHFLAIFQRLRLIMPYVFIFVGGYGKGGLRRRDVSGRLK